MIAKTSAPMRYERSMCLAAKLLHSVDLRSVSETWKVSPIVMATHVKSL